jgi:hypothetical protein
MTPAPPTPVTPAVLHTLIAGLSAYGRLYGLPNSPEQVQGILGTLLRMYQPDRPAIAIDAVTQPVLEGLTSESLKNVMVDRASSALSKAVYRWQQEVTEQATAVLTTYLATYVDRAAPVLASDALPSLVTAVLPLIKDGPVTRSETLGLVSYLVQNFAPQGPAVRETYLPLAAKLATTLGQQPMAQAVADTVAAYVDRYAPGLVTIGVDLIATALSAVIKTQVDLNIDAHLTVLDEKLLIEQVSFQLNILQQSPAPTKSAQAIAKQVKAAVEQYQQSRPPSFDATTGVVRPQGISSGWTSTRLPADPTVPDGDDFWAHRESP